MNRRVAILLALATLALGAAPRASANEVFYYSNFGNGFLGSGTLQKLDLAAGTNTTIVNGLNFPDSLVFSTPTTIVYTQSTPGSVNQVNTDGTNNITLASGNFTQDLALAPDGKSVVVSDTGSDSVLRVDLATGAVTVLHKFSSNVMGITFDPLGNLFVNVDGKAGNEIVQLDPVSGKILGSLTLPSFTGGLADGLTYDPTTNALWASTGLNSGLIKISDPLNSATLIECTAGDSSVCGEYDGLQAGGDGNIFIANNNGFIDQYNIASGTFSEVASAPSIDDLAPLVGAGSPTNVVPEPGTLGLFSMGLAGLGILHRRIIK